MTAAFKTWQALAVHLNSVVDTQVSRSEALIFFLAQPEGLGSQIKIFSRADGPVICHRDCRSNSRTVGPIGLF